MPNYDPERIAVGMSHKIEALELKADHLNAQHLVTLAELRRVALAEGCGRLVKMIDEKMAELRKDNGL